MNSPWRTVLLWLVLTPVLAIGGCCARDVWQNNFTGPQTTNTSSDKFQTLDQKVRFLNKYVTFRRTFESLHFKIQYSNGSAGLIPLPGPSDWDIRLAAVVPASELDQWKGQSFPLQKTPDLDWVSAIPNAPDTSGVREWYEDGGRLIGIDRERRLVVYRLWAY